MRIFVCCALAAIGCGAAPEPSVQRAGLYDCQPAEDFDFVTSGTTTTAYLHNTSNWRGTFTDGAYTVTSLGPSRTFTGDNASVTHTTWVRTLDTRFDHTTMTDTQKTDWLRLARDANCTGSQDILTVAFQYVAGVAPVYNSSGKKIGGDAGYVFGADFHDYLGDDWDPPDGNLVTADPTELDDLDCSGFVRIVYGYRNNFIPQTYYADIPLSLHQLDGYLPRDSEEQYAYGPGQTIVSFRIASQPSTSELNSLAIGDLVFFDLDNLQSGDWHNITHVGIFIGVNSAGNYSFISSRSSLDGPTIDNPAAPAAWSIVNYITGHTYFGARFRAARRL